MFKILIVDDELIVRVGIKSLLDWESHGFEIVDVSCDGEDALKKIKVHKPDIVLTDIVMPNMNGIDLLKVIREKYKYMKVIILSCHNEFEYVKEAMKLGAADYVLKLSMQPQDLLDVLIRCTEIKKEENLLIPGGSIPGSPDPHTPGGNYLANLLLSSLDSGESLPANAGIETGAYFSVLVTRLVDPEYDGQPPRRSKKTENAVINLINDAIPDSFQYESFYMHPRECVTILRVDAEGDPLAILAEIRQIAEHFQLLIHTYLNYKAVTGICEYTLFTSGMLKEAYGNSSAAARHGFYLDEGGIVAWESINYIKEYKNQFNYDFIKHTHEKLKSGDIDHISRSISQLFDGFAEKRNIAPDDIIKIGKALINTFQLFFWESVPPGEQERINAGLSFEQVESVDSLSQLRKHIGKCIDVYNEVFTLIHKGVYHDHIKQMKKYIDQNYMYKINLDHAASFLNLSKSYFCNVFKIETGETFNDYLTGIRIMNAKRLMQETDMSIKTIAENVGFDNVNYFYTLFRKSTGISPKKYKENLQKTSLAVRQG